MTQLIRHSAPAAGAILIAILALCLPAASRAQGLQLPHVPIKLALIQGTDDEAGLHIQLGAGWKFYWRTPGEGGVPAQFDWTGSRNVTRVEVAWPAPQRIPLGKSDIYGYAEEAVLPLRIDRQDGEKPYGLDLALEYGVCKDICILRNDRLLLRSQDALPPTADLMLLAKWRSKVPQPAAQAGIQLVSHRLKPDRLIVVLQSQMPLQRPDLFVEGTPDSWFGRPEAQFSPDGREVRFELAATYPSGKANQPLRLTLVDPAVKAELVLAP
jgi:suppressor for copper-sensitivity B